MAHQLENKKIITLDSLSVNLTQINNSLTNQTVEMINQLLLTEKMITQMRINNMYKAHENDFIIDDNIFENDEIN